MKTATHLTLDTRPGDVALAVESTRDQKQRRMVIKHGDQFLLLDLKAGMTAANGAGLGLYYNDTRFLSVWHWALNGSALEFLTADTGEGFAAAATFSNSSASGIKEQQVFVERKLVLCGSSNEMLEEICVTNYTGGDLKATLSLQFGSDYADMFEVRGDVRKARGRSLAPICQTYDGGIEVKLAYLGLDNVVRETAIDLQGPIEAYCAGLASFALHAPAHGKVVIRARVKTHEYAPGVPQTVNFASSKSSSSSAIDVNAAHVQARQKYESWRSAQALITTGSAAFNEVLEQSYRDLYLLRQTTAGKPAMAAGVPWFAVPFGRDSLVVGLQTLSLMPDMSREVLEVLAHYQGKNTVVETAERPGAIMHELRPGEMARLGEIAFRPYYGTVDATPLWLWLFAEYVLLTGDHAFGRKLWPQVRAALSFAEREIALTGYILYGGRGDTALSNQGWKDSGNCIVYSNGQLAKGPIAVCEAQGYLYAAWHKLSKVASQLGYKSMALDLKHKAVALKARFNRQFYMPEKAFYAIALDGAGKRCDVVSSNPGHLIVTGILPYKRAVEVAKRMLEPDMFTGFGVRTLSSKELAYQPMDYQVGAIWPHDNGFLVAGLCQLGMADEAHRILRALTDVALSQSDRRLPELFCGFDRGSMQTPVPYPVACIPQLWAAGSVFHMTQSLLQMGAKLPSSQHSQIVPDWLQFIKVEGLRRPTKKAGISGPSALIDLNLKADK